ncbi:MAG: FAD:protein FMN transferase [Clostridium sp.]|nr:FAD:protein FMN transferase [Clostridium sp.]
MRQSFLDRILCFYLEKRTFLHVKQIFLVPLLLSAVLCLSSCGQKKEPVVQNGFYFDTVISITLYGESSQLSPLFDEVFAMCKDYETLFDRTLENSDITMINASAGTPVAVRPETISLLQTACSYAELTDGLIDPTIAPLLSLWGLGDSDAQSELTGNADTAAQSESLGGADNDTQSESPGGADNDTQSESPDHEIPSGLTLPPDADALSEVCRHIDYHAIVIDEQAGTVMLTDPQAAIDLGFIAKGYIADRIRDYLVSQGVTSAIINLGGNILCIGEKPDHSSYRVAVRYPFGGAEDVIAALAIRDQSVVTSGVYERFIEVDGIRYHHILNPQTGYPVENGLLSVTIVADSSTDADALSTACFVLGLSDGMALIESLERTEALFITDDYELHYSSGLKENP